MTNPVNPQQPQRPGAGMQLTIGILLLIGAVLAIAFLNLGVVSGVLAWVLLFIGASMIFQGIVTLKRKQ